MTTHEHGPDTHVLSHRIRTLGVLSLCIATLNACQYIIPQPQPNETLSVLAHDAHTDSTLFDATAASVREAHYTQLTAEIARLCGVDAQGNSAESCDDAAISEAVRNAPTVDDSPDPAASLQLIEQVFSELPEDTKPLIATQYHELSQAAQLQPELDELKLAEDDIEVATEALQRAFAERYALGVALAWADADTASAIHARLERLESLISVLEVGFDDAQHIPVPEPAYTFNAPYVEPTDAASAQELYTQLLEDATAFWIGVSQQAQAPDFAILALRASAH